NVLSIAVDAQGNVYAGDGGNKRIQVFDNNGVFKTAFTNFGNAQAMCITKGANPVLYVSKSNPWNDIDVAGEIYRMRPDGTVLDLLDLRQHLDGAGVQVRYEDAVLPESGLNLAEFGEDGVGVSLHYPNVVVVLAEPELHLSGLIGGFLFLDLLRSRRFRRCSG